MANPDILQFTITSLAESEMSSTIFPTLPGDVAVLTTGEFRFDLEWNDALSFDEICRRFGNDVNRALVWLIRFRALKAWCARDGIALSFDAERMSHLCEAAARFELNDQWEFDADTFCLAVDTIATRRARRDRA
jgi:hypothetical protein